MDRKWTPKENEIFFSMWPKVVNGSISKDDMLSALSRRTWKAICRHAEECVKSEYPKNLMSISAAAEKSGYNKITLLRILKRQEVKISARSSVFSSKHIEPVRPQMMVEWQDVLEAIRLENEYVSSARAAREMGVRLATLIKVARDLGVVREEKQAGKTIFVHKDQIESIRRALPKTKKTKQSDDATL